MKKLHLTILVLLAGAGATQAADVLMKASDASGTSSLSAAGQWTDGLAPNAANNYYSSNFFIRTPAAGNVTFVGNSLTLQPPAGQAAPMRSMLFKGGNNAVVTINNLTNAGGVINLGSGSTAVPIFAGNLMTVISNSTIQADQANMIIGYPLAGPSGVTLTNTTDSGHTARTITYTNDLSGFKGQFLVDANVNLVLTHPNALGNSTTPVTDQIILNSGATLTANTNLTLANANGGITLNGNANLSFGNTNLTFAIAEPISGGFTLTKRGGGILTLAGDNSNLSGGVTMFTFTAGSQLNINSATALGTGLFTLGAGAVAPAILDNTSGSAKTLTTGNFQTWSSGFTFLGSSSLNMGVSAVTMTANTTATVSNNNLTVGNVNGGFALTKQGAGTLTIDGGGYYTGNTTVSEGTLVLATVSSLSSPVITVSSNATLNTSGLGLTLAYGQTLTGGGTVVGNVSDAAGAGISPGASAGTLTINGNLALTGGGALNFDLTPTPTVGGGVNDLIVVSGALSFGNSSGSTTLNLIGSAGSGAIYTLFQYGTFSGDLVNVIVPPGFALTNNTANQTIQLISLHTAANLTWRGDGAANAWDINTTANWIQDGTNQFFFNSDNVTFDDSGSNNIAVMLALDVSPAAVIVNAAQNYTFSGAGIVAGSLTKSGSGTLVLDNANSYSGATVINAGILQLGDSTGLAGGLTYGESGAMGTGPVTNNGSLVFSRVNDLTLAAKISGSGSISNIGSGGMVTLSGSVSGSTVAQAGGGSLSLNASNDYTGLTVVSAGTLYLGNPNALGSTAAGTEVYSGANLRVNVGQAWTITGEALTLDGGQLARGGSQVLVYAGAITLGAAGGTFNVDGGATILPAPAISGPGGLTKSGSGTLVLTNANGYTGKTFLNGGTVQIASLDALGPNPGVATPDFVTFSGGMLAVTNNQTVSGGTRGLTIGTSALLAVSDATATLTVNGDLNGGGNLSKRGPGTLVLTGSNPWAGAALYLDGTSSDNDGITRIASPTALANLTVSPGMATIFQGNNNAGWSTLQLDGAGGSIVLPQDWAMNCRNNDNPNIQNVAGNNTLSGEIRLDVGGSRVNFQSDAGLLTLGGNQQYVGTLTGGRAYTFTGAGNILVSGVINNSANGAPISLTKNGTGKLTLSAANTYGNTTTVNGGVLELTGSITGTNGVVVNGGALAGTGTITDHVTVSNSIASGTIDSLAVNGNYTIAGTLTVDVNRSGALSDLATVSGGTVSAVAGTINVNNLGAALQVGDTFTLFTQPVSGGAALAVAGGGATWNNDLATSGSIQVVSVIPTTPTTITATPSGSDLNLSWPASHLGWVLQTQTNALTVGISTNWVDVPGSAALNSTNIAVNPALPTMFFRLRYP